MAQRCGKRACVEPVQHPVDVADHAPSRLIAQPRVYPPDQIGKRGARPRREPELDGLVREVAPDEGEAVPMAVESAWPRWGPQGRRRRTRTQGDHTRAGDERGLELLFIVGRGRRESRRRRPAGRCARSDGQRRPHLHAFPRGRSQRFDRGGEPAVAAVLLVPADVQRIGRSGRGDVEQALVLGRFLSLVLLQQVVVEPGARTGAVSDVPGESHG